MNNPEEFFRTCTETDPSGGSFVKAKVTIGTVTTSENLTQVDSNPVDTGTGAAGPGTQRVAVSSDSTIGSTIADGADVTQGALADVAVEGDVAGSLSAKLRGISKMLKAGQDYEMNMFVDTGAGNVTIIEVSYFNIVDHTFATSDYFLPSGAAHVVVGPLILLGQAGQKVSAQSVPSVLSTEQEAILTSMDTALNNPTLGQDTMANSFSVVIASDQSVITTGGTTGAPIVTPTLSVAGAYVTGDYVGQSTTPQSFAGAVRVAGSTGVIQSITIVTKTTASFASANMELWLFDQTLTVPTDNAAWSITDADALKCLGVIPISGNNWFASAANQVYTAGGLGVTIKPVSTTLFYALVIRGSYTFAAGNLQIQLGILQD